MDRGNSSVFNQPIVQQDWAISVKPALLPIVASFFLLFISAVTLPCKSRAAIYFRLSLLPLQLMLAYDICVNKNYSLGSAFRDSAFPAFAFMILYRSLDFSIVNLWDAEPAFHWIVPDHDPSSAVSELTVESPNDKPIIVRWRKVPHPPLFSFDRMIWALDNLTLSRPGTPFLFPWKVRALEWSQRALESPDTKFGVPEWPLLPAIIQQLVHLGCHFYIRHQDIKPGQQIWDLPLFVQCTLSFALGGAVAFSNALEEAIFFPLILKFKVLPRTALVSHSKRAITSAGIGELWGKRWHHAWRRSFTRLTRIIPGSSYLVVGYFSAFWMRYVLYIRFFQIVFVSQDAHFY
ncbi:hypothetical protein PCASD_16089 [Puccinia coronata f. sp. avenae]|uniref:Wax synthase domain-containing protein n=1 Tax=Puccinia coronata f. sp. avenae TaxID=200324 RepID=A0A2N5TXW4_9BASI|nr:hypothetical protein PCASD_16089 [Puccinia coronata f. sp. avenae]